MANLTESPIYEPGIFQLEKSTPPLGGAPVIDNGVPSAGHANAQAQQLANRTANHQVRLTQAEADIVSLQGETGDFSDRVTTVEDDIETLQGQVVANGSANDLKTLLLSDIGSDNVGFKQQGSSTKRILTSKLSDLTNPVDFGAVADGVTNDTVANQTAYSKITTAGGGIFVSPPKSVTSSAIGSNSVTPTLVRSDKPSILGVYSGSPSLPSVDDDPALWVQKWVSYDSGTDRYRQSLGAIFGEVNALGSGSTTNQNDGSWSGVLGNARIKNTNVGTGAAPITDAVGSLTGVIGFAKADFFPGNGTAITGLWGYPSTITATDAEFDALNAAGQGWATIGLEVNIQIDHKDVGYRESIAGASSTVGAWLHNYRSSTTVAKHWNFGQVIDGGAIDGNSANLASSNWAGQYVGLKIDDSVNYGILFGKRFKNNSILIKGPDNHTLTGERPLAFADTGDNPIIWGSYTGSIFNNNMMWQNAGTLFYRKLGASYDVMLNGEKALFQNATGVGINTKTPGFNLDITSAGATFSAVTSYGTGSSLVLRAALGTAATPTALTTDSNIGFIAGRGYTGTAFTSASPAGIGFYAAETWTSSANGSYVTVGTTPTGSVTRLERLRIDAAGSILPGTDNTQSIGSTSKRFSVIYAGTGTINTSDERAKTEIRNISDAEQSVAKKCKSLIKAFKFKDAVELKQDKARIHFGVIAQDLIEAFSSEGLDATDYAILCHDSWEKQDEIKDADGEIVQHYMPAGDRYGVRYEELLAFIISAM